MISRPAIEPAIPTLPVNSQLIANVSSVPNVRQLNALRTDLVCVSAPRKDITLGNLLLNGQAFRMRRAASVRVSRLPHAITRARCQRRECVLEAGLPT